MKRFLLGYSIAAGAIALYAWQTPLARPAPAYTPAPSLDDYAWLASVTVLKALPALLALLLCAYIAARIWERLRWASADEYGRLPFRRRYLEEAPDLAVEALAAYHGTERARAEHQVPDRFTFAPHLRFASTAAAPALEVEHTPAGTPTFAELLSRGLVGTGQPLILGYTNGTPLQGSWRDLYSSAVAGISGSGKTTTIRFLAAQAALHGARFAILDPHADTGEESLAATLSALQPAMLCEPAINERDMLAVVKLMQSQLDARLAGGTDRTPLLLAIDEYTRLMRSNIAGDLTGLVEAIAQEGRKVGIFCLLSGQIWTADRAGGTPVRDALASAYIHRIRRGQARLLITPDEARIAENLQPSRALLLRTNGECEPVSIPLCTVSDTERVGALLQPARTQLETAAHSAPSPKAARIVKTLWPDAQTGARYQQRSAEVQTILRDYLARA